MTDLKNGIIDLGDLTITRDTTKEGLLRVYGDVLSTISSDSWLRFKRLFTIDGHQFGCWFIFDQNGDITSVEMTPWIEYKSEEWDRAGQQEERREFCDKWLFEKLGFPHQPSTNVTLYSYEGLEIYSISHFDQRNGADAGHIVIRFLR